MATPLKETADRIDLALALLDEHGPDGVTADTVARGVTPYDARDKVRLLAQWLGTAETARKLQAEEQTVRLLRIFRETEKLTVDTADRIDTAYDSLVTRLRSLGIDPAEAPVQLTGSELTDLFQTPDASMPTTPAAHQDHNPTPDTPAYPFTRDETDIPTPHFMEDYLAEVLTEDFPGDVSMEEDAPTREEALWASDSEPEDQDDAGATGLPADDLDILATLLGVDSAMQVDSEPGDMAIDLVPSVDYTMVHGGDSGLPASRENEQADEAGGELPASGEVRSDRWIPFGGEGTPEAFEFTPAPPGTRTVTRMVDGARADTGPVLDAVSAAHDAAVMTETGHDAAPAGQGSARPGQRSAPSSPAASSAQAPAGSGGPADTADATGTAQAGEDTAGQEAAAEEAETPRERSLRAMGPAGDWVLRREAAGAREVERLEVGPAETSPDGKALRPWVGALDGAIDIRTFEARRYRLPSGEFATSAVVRVYLERSFGGSSFASDEQLERLRDSARAGVDAMWNTGHRLPDGDVFRLDLEFVTDPDTAHHTVTVYGHLERANHLEWGTNTRPNTIAHEVGHLLGLEDEYRERDEYGRRAVYLDGTLMGASHIDPTGRFLVDTDLMSEARHSGRGTQRIPPRHLRQLGAGIEQARKRSARDKASLEATLRDWDTRGEENEENGEESRTEEGTAPNREDQDRDLLRPASPPARARFSPDVLRAVLHGESRPGRGGRLAPGAGSSRPRPLVLDGTTRPNGTYRAEYPEDGSSGAEDRWLPGAGDLAGVHPQRGLMMFPAHWTEEDAVYGAEQAYLHALRDGAVRPAPGRGATQVWTGEYAGVRIEGEVVGGAFTGFRPSDDQPGTPAPAYAPPVPLGTPQNGPLFGQRVEDLVRYGDRRTLGGAHHAPKVDEMWYGLVIRPGQENDNGTYQAEVRFLDPSVSPHDVEGAADASNWRPHRDGDQHVMFPADWAPHAVLDAVSAAHDAAVARGMSRPVDDRGTYHWVGTAQGVRVEGLVRDDRHLVFRPTAVQPYPRWPGRAPVGEALDSALVSGAGRSLPLDVRHVLFDNGQQGVELVIRFHLAAAPGTDTAQLESQFDRLRRSTASGTARAWRRSGSDGPLLRLDLVRVDSAEEAHHSLQVGPENVDDFPQQLMELVPAPADLRQLAVDLLDDGAPGADRWRLPADTDATAAELGQEELRHALDVADPFGRPTTLREPDPTERGDWPSPPVREDESVSEPGWPGFDAEPGWPGLDMSRPSDDSPRGGEGTPGFHAGGIWRSGARSAPAEGVPATAEGARDARGETQHATNDTVDPASAGVDPSAARPPAEEPRAGLPLDADTDPAVRVDLLSRRAHPHAEPGPASEPDAPVPGAEPEVPFPGAVETGPASEPDAPVPGTEPEVPFPGAAETDPASEPDAPVPGAEPEVPFPGAVETGRARIRPVQDARWVGEPYGGCLWIRHFEARRYRLPSGEFGSVAAVRLFLDQEPGRQITEEALTDLRQRAQQGVDERWNTGHRLPNGDLFRVDLEFVTERDSAHHVVTVHSGYPRANHMNWGTDTKPHVLAHEVGHLLGLEDEYREGDRNRQRAVYEDEGLMGPFLRDGRGRPAVDNDHAAGADLGRMRIAPRYLRQLGAWIEGALKTARLRTAHGVAFSTEDTLYPRADGLPTRAHFALDVRRSVLYGEARTGGGGRITPAPASDRPRPVALEGTARPNGTYRATYPDLHRRAVRENPTDLIAGGLLLSAQPDPGLMMFPAHWTEEDAVYAAEQAYLHALRNGTVPPVPGRPGVHTWRGEYAGVWIEGEVSQGVFTGFRPSDDQADTLTPTHAAPPAPAVGPHGGPVFGRRVEDLVRYGDRRTRTGAHHEPGLEPADQMGFHGLQINRGQEHHNGTYDAEVFFLHPGLRVGPGRPFPPLAWEQHVDGDQHVMFPREWRPETLLDNVEKAHGSALDAGTVRWADDRGTYHWVGTAAGVRIEGLVRDGRHLVFRPTYVQPHVSWPEFRPVGEVWVPSVTVASDDGRVLPFDVRHLLFANGQRAVELTVRIYLDPAPGTDLAWMDKTFAAVRQTMPGAVIRAANVAQMNGALVGLTLLRTDDVEQAHHTLFVVGRDVRLMTGGIVGFLPKGTELRAFVEQLVNGWAPPTDAWRLPADVDQEDGPWALIHAVERLAFADPFGRPTTLREPDPSQRGDWPSNVPSGAPSAPPADFDDLDETEINGLSLLIAPGTTDGDNPPTTPTRSDQTDFSSLSDMSDLSDLSDSETDDDITAPRAPARTPAYRPAPVSTPNAHPEEEAAPEPEDDEERPGAGDVTGEPEPAGQDDEVSAAGGPRAASPAVPPAPSGRTEAVPAESSFHETDAADGRRSPGVGRALSAPFSSSDEAGAAQEREPAAVQQPRPAAEPPVAAGESGAAADAPQAPSAEVVSPVLGSAVASFAGTTGDGPARPGEADERSSGQPEDQDDAASEEGAEAAHEVGERRDTSIRIESQLDSHRPPRIDLSMPAPSPQAGPVLFDDDSRLPEHFGFSQYTLRGVDSVVQAITDRLGAGRSGSTPGLDEALEDLRRALGATAHVFDGDGYESPAFGHGLDQVLRVTTRPYGNWERFADVQADPAVRQAEQASRVTTGTTKKVSSSTGLSAGVALGPGAWAVSARVGAAAGVTRAQQYVMGDRSTARLEQYSKDGSHLHLDDVWYEVSVSGPPRLGSAGRGRNSGVPGEDTFGFAVRHGLAVRLPDSATAPGEPGRVPSRIELGPQSDYRLVHTEGYGPVKRLRDLILEKLELDGARNKAARERIAGFFSSENFHGLADRLARGPVTTGLLSADDGSPLGAVIVERAVPGEAELLTESRAVELRSTIQQTVTNERVASRTSSRELSAGVGKFFDSGNPAWGPVVAGIGGSLSRSTTQGTVFGGSGSRKTVGRVKRAPTALYRVVKTVTVRLPGVREPVSVETWSLDRMTHTEARRLAGWDDGTTLRARNAVEPFAPLYLTPDRPAMLGMSRVETLTHAGGNLTGPDGRRGLLETFTDRVIYEAAARHPDLFVPLGESGTPDSRRRRDMLHYNLALQNTLTVMNVLSYHSVAGSLEALTTTGITIDLMARPTGLLRPHLSLHISGVLTGRRYEGTQNDVTVRAAAPGTTRLDGSHGVTRAIGAGTDASVRVNLADGARHTVTVSAGPRWERAEGRGGDHGSTVSHETLAEGSTSSHLFGYDLELTARIDGFSRYRSGARAASLGVLGMPSFLRQEGDTALASIRGRVLLSVPDEHTPATDPHADGAGSPRSVVEPLDMTEARALVTGEPHARGDLPTASESHGQDVSGDEGPWHNVFGSHPYQTLSIGAHPELNSAAEELMAELSGGSWRFTRTGALPHDFLMRHFQPQYLAAGFDQASGSAGSRLLLRAQGGLRDRDGTVVHRIRVLDPVVVSKPVTIATEHSLAMDLQAAGSASTTRSSAWSVGVTAAHALTGRDGTVLSTAYGLSYGRAGSLTTATAVSRTVTFEVGHGDDRHHVLVAGDTRHELAGSLRPGGALGPLLSSWNRNSFAGRRLTFTNDWLGHLPEKAAHELGFIQDGLGRVPRYTARPWTLPKWLHDHPFGSYAAGALDTGNVLTAFMQELQNRGVAVDETGLERLRDMVSPRALRALREHLTSTGAAARTRLSHRNLAGIRIGGGFGSLRVELIAGESTFDRLDHGLVVWDARVATMSETEQRSAETSRGAGWGITQGVGTISSAASPHPGDLTAVRAGLSGRFGTADQLSSSRSRTQQRMQMFYTVGPHAEYLTGYELRLTLDRGNGETVTHQGSVGLLREQMPLSLTVPEARSVTEGDPLGTPTLDTTARSVRLRARGELSQQDIDDWRSVARPDGTRAPFEPPAQGFQVRRVSGLRNLREAGELAVAAAYGTRVDAMPDRARELTGRALDAALEKARDSALTRPGTVSGLALDEAISDAALAPFFAESGARDGYRVLGLDDDTSVNWSHGQYRLYSKPDLSRATLLTVFPDSAMITMEGDATSAGTALSHSASQGVSATLQPVLSAGQAGSAVPAVSGTAAAGEADRRAVSATQSAATSTERGGRHFLFAVPTAWLGIAEVQRWLAFGRVRPLPQGVHADTVLEVLVSEDVARDLGLVDDGNFPPVVQDAWTQVTEAGDAWAGADRAYWQTRRELAELRENTQEPEDTSEPENNPEPDNSELLETLRRRAEDAVGEYHRVRAEADRLTRWHRLPAEAHRPGEPETRAGLTEPPAVVFTAADRDPDPERPVYVVQEGAPGDPELLISPESPQGRQSYTLYDVPEDGDGFYHALAEGLHHADPERLGTRVDVTDRQELVGGLRRLLADELHHHADLLAVTSPDTGDTFSADELEAGGITSTGTVRISNLKPGTMPLNRSERRELADSGHIPLHTVLPEKQREGLAREQLLRGGDAPKRAGWDHGAADLLPVLAARAFGVRVTVVGADGRFQDFWPSLSEAADPAEDQLPHIVLQLKDQHYRPALPSADARREPPLPAPAEAAQDRETPAARPARPAYTTAPWAAGSGPWRPAFTPGRTPTLTGPDGTVHTLVEPVGDGNGFWSAVAGGPHGPDGDRGAPAGDGVWDEATERDAVGHAADVLGVGVTVVDEDGTVRLPADGGRAYGRPVILYRRAGEYLLARPDRDPADASAVRPDGGADDENGVEGVRDPAAVVPGDRTPDRTAHDRPEDGGAVVTPEAAEGRYGMPVKNFDKFRRFASEHGLVIDVRPTNPEAPRWLARGALPKPKEIKAKTINALDVLLGAHPDHVGLVGYFEPTAPERTSGMGDEVWDRLQQRYEQRSREFEDLAPTMARLAAEGTFTVRDGVVQGRDDAGAERPITGDHDIFDISTPGGSKLTPRSYDQTIGDMRANDMGVMHGAHLYWAAEPKSPFSESVFKKILESHRHGGEPLLRFGPGDVNTRLAWSDPPRISLTVTEAPPVVDSTEADPADQDPADQDPADQDPADQDPGNQGPAEESPAEQSRADRGPAEESLAEQGPVEQSRAEESRADRGPAEESLAGQDPSGPEFDVELRALLDSADLLATPVGPHDVAGLTYAPQAAAFWALTQEPQRLADLRLAPADVEDLLRRNPALFTPAIQAAFTRLTAHRKAKETGPGPGPGRA
ncbi:EndoU domain-containing protein [Streptomyces sp. DSM 15324]|uniref:EndoU domain-containing protein n=1 Tax=Streptomyces sp. DSM 15324 TaxID=1739111 RepID=UPI001F31FE09|nr:EndoU domain-containing protein [Streptomyces sp. DSM 15324]